MKDSSEKPAPEYSGTPNFSYLNSYSPNPPIPYSPQSLIPPRPLFPDSPDL